MEIVSVPGVFPYEPLGFTNCVRVGEMLYLSGIGPLDADGNLVAPGIDDQTAATFENIEAILRATGAGLEHIAQMTSFVVELASNGPRYVDARRRILRSPTFTSATVGVTELLVPGMLLEVQCCAEVP
jgi:enamine deaminase RidA (YjgF/YER057c/UK114 family)